MKYVDYFVQALLSPGHALLAQECLSRIEHTEKDGRTGWRIPIAGRSISGSPAKVLQRLTGFDLADCEFLVELEAGLQPVIKHHEINLKEYVYTTSRGRTYPAYHCVDMYGLEFFLADGANFYDRFYTVLAQCLTEQIPEERRSKKKIVALPVRGDTVYRIGALDVYFTRVDGKIYSHHADIAFRLSQHSGVPHWFLGFDEWKLTPDILARLDRAEKYHRRNNENNRYR